MKNRKTKKKIEKSTKSSARKGPIKTSTKMVEALPTVVKPCEPPKTVPVMIRTKFYGNSVETQQVIGIPVVENDTIRLDLTIDLRKSEFILIQPVRRPITDIEGMIGDAQSLANG